MAALYRVTVIGASACTALGLYQQILNVAKQRISAPLRISSLDASKTALEGQDFVLEVGGMAGEIGTEVLVRERI